ncbi:hypothetical protein MKW98_003720, partial [Papaver atlanticum]
FQIFHHSTAKYFEDLRVSIIFGLNTLNGRTITRDYSAVGPWDFINSAALIGYTVDKNYSIYGWELGK